jgi:hypothetical protein
MTKQGVHNQPDLRAIIWAGVAAGISSTVAQVLLWLVFTDEFPAILFRDARLTAALVLGSGVLPPPATFAADAWLAATFIHFVLSICYVSLLSPFAVRYGAVLSLLMGAVFGVAIYAVNLYGFTELFPWFAQARGWIAAVAHVVFGMTAISAYRHVHFRNARFRSGVH